MSDQPTIRREAVLDLAGRLDARAGTVTVAPTGAAADPRAGARSRTLRVISRNIHGLVQLELVRDLDAWAELAVRNARQLVTAYRSDAERARGRGQEWVGATYDGAADAYDEALEGITVLRGDR